MQEYKDDLEAEHGRPEKPFIEKSSIARPQKEESWPIWILRLATVVVIIGMLAALARNLLASNAAHGNDAQDEFALASSVSGQAPVSDVALSITTSATLPTETSIVSGPVKAAYRQALPLSEWDMSDALVFHATNASLLPPAGT